ncbi:hypothetical protein HH216_22375 [Spirosoma rhododendri]|uniref:Uncharacterized protein n=2 Tax=Spirosoma rhododendri TaxID=2728024 RepID=A0A7L5DSQ8_9BACT|nr:hypothetical protein HH216_22375 [Spirosoma rhododendri]
MPTAYHWRRTVLLSSLLLLLFFGFKIGRFQSLYYTFNDMYIFIQSSCSWLDGRPVLYENIWGYDSRIHNNYILLLIGPLIYLGGVYGAFAVLTGLLLLSYGLLLRTLAGRGQWFLWLAFAVLLFGPVWFWFNDHPGIGWHPELLYYPLVLLLTLALFYAETAWYFWVTALLIVLVKEDGALMAGTVHLSYLCLTYLRANSTRSILGILSNRRFWLTAAGWALVFVAGMLFLSYKNQSVKPEPRLEQALTAIRTGLTDPTFIRTNLLLLGQTLALLLPSIVLLWVVMKRADFRQSGSVWLIYAVAQLALLASNWVQGSTYYGTNPLFYLVSLTWPPRFVLNYAFSVSFVVAFWLLVGADARPLPRQWVIGLAVVLFVVQVPIVKLSRPDVDYKTTLIDTFTHRFDPFKERLLPAEDVAVVERLVRLIPPRSSVFMFDFLIPFFHRHYNIWLTGKQWKNADVAIVPVDDFQGLTTHLPQVMKQPYRRIRLRMYEVYVTPAYERYVNQAIHDN